MLVIHARNVYSLPLLTKLLCSCLHHISTREGEDRGWLITSGQIVMSTVIDSDGEGNGHILVTEHIHTLDF